MMTPSRTEAKAKRVRPTLINIFSGKHKPIGYIEAKFIRAKPRSCNSVIDAINQAKHKHK